MTLISKEPGWGWTSRLDLTALSFGSKCSTPLMIQGSRLAMRDVE